MNDYLRILIVSNLYPPYHVGGYEIGCQDLVRSLLNRGHRILVLTGKPPATTAQTEDDGVVRILETSFAPTLSPRATWIKEAVNQLAFAHTCGRFQPHAVLFFNLKGVSLSLIMLAQDWNLPSFLVVCDSWLAHAEDDHWAALCRSMTPGASSLSAKLLGLRLLPETLSVPFAVFASRHLQRSFEATGKRASRSVVLPWGIDVQVFAYRPAELTEVRRLLYVGQVVPHKGLHTLIEALALLRKQPAVARFNLTVAGDIGPSSGPAVAEYFIALRHALEQAGLEEDCRFLGRVDRRELPALYAAHDALVMPSIWEEPFGLVRLEAMACGLPVISSDTGASPEVTRDGETGLLFEAGDPVSCAHQIRRLWEEPGLAGHLRTKARQEIEARYRLQSTAAGLETLLSSSHLGAARIPLLGIREQAALCVARFLAALQETGKHLKRRLRCR